MPLTKRPAVICDGRICDGRPLLPRKVPRRLRNATLTRSDGPGNGAVTRALRDHLGGDVADAGAGEADGTGSALGEVEYASPDEGTTVIDGDDHALAAMGHPELGAERQRAVGCGHGVLIEALTGGSLAAGFITVKGGLSREARRADRGIGVQPIAALGFVRVAGVMAVMPGFGGRFGDAATDQESCGD